MKSLLIISFLICCGFSMAQSPTDTPVSQMEYLDRGLIAFPTTAGKCFISWRFLGTDDNSTSFEVLKNGVSYQKDIINATSMTVNGSKDDIFQVVTFHNGQPVDTTAVVTPWDNCFLKLHLDRPEKMNGADYNPNDCSVGDVDGDGQYEIFVKWDPENAKDNAQSGMTSPVIIDCYKLDGTRLWRVNLGDNIRAGAHYTQFMVYDFNGDGKAEMICKTAPGSKDGNDNFVNAVATDATILSTSNNVDLRNSDGRILRRSLTTTSP